MDFITVIYVFFFYKSTVLQIALFFPHIIAPCSFFMCLSTFYWLSLSGIILKMARMIKDGSLRGQKSVVESVSKPPSKTFIIPAKDLVQVIAKVCSISYAIF